MKVKRPKLIYIALKYKYNFEIQLSYDSLRYIPSGRDKDYSKLPRKKVGGICTANNIKYAMKILGVKDKHFILQMNYKEFKQLMIDANEANILEGWQCIPEDLK